MCVNALMGTELCAKKKKLKRIVYLPICRDARVGRIRETGATKARLQSPD